MITEDSEEERDSGDENESDEKSMKYIKGIGLFAPEDFIHAFSHFTYRFSGRKKLVCELQGVYDGASMPPIFEHTDPAIHYASTSTGKSAVYGKSFVLVNDCTFPVQLST